MLMWRGLFCTSCGPVLHILHIMWHMVQIRCVGRTHQWLALSEFM